MSAEEFEFLVRGLTANAGEPYVRLQLGMCGEDGEWCCQAGDYDVQPGNAEVHEHGSTPMIAMVRARDRRLGR